MCCFFVVEDQMLAAFECQPVSENAPLLSQRKLFTIKIFEELDMYCLGLETL